MYRNDVREVDQRDARAGLVTVPGRLRNYQAAGLLEGLAHRRERLFGAGEAGSADGEGLSADWANLQDQLRVGRHSCPFVAGLVSYSCASNASQRPCS